MGTFTIAPTYDKATLDAMGVERQARLFNALMFGRWADAYPDATVGISESSSKMRTVTTKAGHQRQSAVGGWKMTHKVSICDADAIVAAEFDHLRDPFMQGYVSANIQTHPEVITGTGRGTEAAHDGFTALYVDMDTRRDGDDPSLPSGHRTASKELPLPTMQQAKEFLNKLSEVLGADGKRFLPTIVQQTSDEGLHAIWCADFIIPKFDGDDPDNIANRWNSLTQNLAFESGFSLDSVSRDTARVLRSPGQRRIKPSARSLAGLSDNRYDALMNLAAQGDEDAKAELERRTAQPLITEASQTRLLAVRPGNMLTHEIVERLPKAVKLLRDAPASKHTSTSSATSTTVPAAKHEGDYQQSDADRVVDAMDAMQMGELLLDIDPVGGGRFRWANGSSPTSGEVKEGKLFVNSETMNANLGTHGVLSPTSLLRLALRHPETNDTRLARTVINHLGSMADDEQRFEWLASLGMERFSGESDDLPGWREDNRAMVEATLATEGVSLPVEFVEVQVATEDANTEVVARVTTDEQKLTEVMRSMPRDGEHTFTVTSSGMVTEGEGRGTWRLRIGGPDNGTYRVSVKRAKDADGDMVEEEVETRLSNAVLLRTSRTTLLRSLSGDDEPVTYDVTVITPQGRTVVHGLTPKASVNVADVLAMAGVGGTVPTRRDDAVEMQNCINQCGLGTQQRALKFGKTGWSTEGGVVRFVTDGNSLGPDGIDIEVRLDVDRSAVVSRLADRMPDRSDFEAIPAMLDSMFAFMPGGRHIAAALTMNAVAAVQRLESTDPNVTLWLTGKTNSGKTRSTYLCTAWSQGGVGSPWGRPLVDLKACSKMAPGQEAAIHGDMVSLFDDLRVGGVDDTRSVSDAMFAARAVTTMVHDRAGRRTATVGQRTRGGGMCDASAIITSETGLTGNGGDESPTAKSLFLGEVVAGRTVNFDMVPVLDLAGNPVIGIDGKPVMRYRGDAHLQRFGPTMSRLWTGFIAWLRADIINNAGGDIATWASQNSARTNAMKAILPAGRTAAPVARLLAGWARFGEYVKEQSGVVLPTWMEFAEPLLADALDAVQSASAGNALSVALRTALETGSGFLADGKAAAPRQWATRVGWMDKGGMCLTTLGSAKMLGYLSDDGQWVVMSTSHLEALMSMPQQAAKRTLLDLTPEEDRDAYGPKNQSARWRGFAGQQVRGWRISTKTLGLDLGEEDDDADNSTTPDF